MKRFVRWGFVVGALMGLGGATSQLEAQKGTEPRTQVISANPFGLIFGLFNVEYDRKVSESATAGIGGSWLGKGTAYVNGDIFYRYYLSGTPFRGFEIGLKVGATKFSEPDFQLETGHTLASFSVGYGFDVAYNWIMGPSDNVAIGLGFGIKKLLGENPTMRYIPTFRIINVGIAF